MEARSLATLNDLAANPPQYPEKPTDKQQEPLTLYISRVPGTRDVILSPFKPQLRNVTSEDVANSFYYVHLEMASGELDAPGPIRDANNWRSSEEESSPISIPRKPLPNTTRPLTPDSPPRAPQTTHQRGASSGGAGAVNMETPRYDAATVTSDDGPILPGIAALSPLSMNDTAPEPLAAPAESQSRAASGLHTGMPARKPLGPRPLGSSAPVVAEPADVTAKENIPPRDSSLQDNVVNLTRPARKPVLPLDCSVLQEGGENPPLPPRPPVEVGERRSRSLSPRKRSGSTAMQSGTPFTLTLIRRDPTSERQWNVGRVSSRQLEASLESLEDEGNMLGNPATSSSRPHPSIDIELETSGYAKFRNMPVRKSAETDLNAALSALSKGTPPRGEIGVFSRQVAMGYSKSWTTNLREKLQRMEHAGRSRMGRNRSDSVESVESNGSDTAPAIETIVTSGPAPHGMKARGYTFTSPWDGKCEFRTGHGGRSVQCRHTPYDQGGGDAAVYNPLVGSDSQVPGILKSAANPVSELRFNLPSSEIFAEQAKASKDQWRGNFSKLLRPGHEAGDGEEGEGDDALSPFDINVGSERAGGGNRGRRAKLGKLIVFDDGQKMLDLVVAANVGIWWGAWEKNF